MLAKAMITKVSDDEKTAMVQLLEHNMAETIYLPFYGSYKSVGSFAIVAYFNGEFNDGYIL